MSQVAIIDSEIFDNHIPDSGLPERPARTIIIRKALRKHFKRYNIQYTMASSNPNQKRFPRTDP